MLPREARAGGRPARVAARPLSAGGLAVAAALALAALAGCGGGDGGPAEPLDPPPASGATELRVNLHPEGRGGTARRAEVSCPAEDQRGAEACEALEEVEADDADPVPAGVACTQIYGGADVAELEGRLHGEDLDAELTRENGCEIDRFDRFLPLLNALFPGYEPGAALGP